MTKDFRIIIFPASRPILENEQSDICQKTSTFLEKWKAHGEPLFAEIEIVYQQFIIIKIDETQTMASGCSLDNLNGIMREIEAQYQLGIFNRMKACFLENNEVKTMPLAGFRSAIKESKINHNIQVFDFSVANADDFQKKFLLPLNESWAKTFIKI